MKRVSIFLLLAMLFSISSHAIDKDTDGYYLIGSDADYEEFRAMVRQGNPYANARLTADITAEQPLGMGYDFHYRGTFDGNGHTITMNIVNTENYADGFGFVQHGDPGCVIRNLHLAGTIESNQKYLGSFVGTATSVTLENCISSATMKCGVSGDATLGGLIGQAFGEVVIDNCAFVGKVEAPNATDCAGFIGYINQMSQIKSSFVSADFNISNATPVLKNNAFGRNIDTKIQFFSNNYYCSEKTSLLTNEEEANAITTEETKNGLLCYRLNKNGKKGVVWHQEEGVDYPVPFSTANTKMAVNHLGDIILTDKCSAHDYYGSNHICKHCGFIEPGAKIEPLQFSDFTSFKEDGSEGYVGYIYYTINKTDHTAEVAGLRNGHEPGFGPVTAVTVPETINVGGEVYTVTSIGSNVFNKNEATGWPWIQHVYIPKTVKTINNYAFRGTSVLKYLHIADGTEPLYIGVGDGQEMFYDSPLEKVYIGRNLSWSKDGDEPFEDRHKISEIIFGPRVTLVGNSNYSDPREGNNYDLFNDAKGVQKVAFLGDEASLAGPKVNIRCVDGMYNATNYYVNRTLESSSYLTYTVGSNGYGIFDKTEQVAFGPFVKDIPESAYSGTIINRNNYLKKADFSNAINLETIGKEAFKSTYIDDIDLSNTKVKTIGEQAFYDCNKAASIKLPGTVLEIKKEAFNGCDDNTTQIILYPSTDPSNPPIKFSENSEAFSSCDNLVYAYIDRELEYTHDFYGKGSPFYDSYCVSAIIGDNVTKLPPFLFEKCNKLQSIVIGKNVTEIGEGAFDECSSLSSLTIHGDSLHTAKLNIKDYQDYTVKGNTYNTYWADAFHCAKLSSIFLGRELDHPLFYTYPYEGSTYLPEKIVNVTIGEGVKEIAGWSFDNFSNMKSIRIPANVVEIRKGAFRNCKGLAYVDINAPATVVSEAFSNLESLKEVRILDKGIKLQDNAFLNCKTPEKVMVNFPENPGKVSGAAFGAETADIYKNTPLQNVGESKKHSIDLAGSTPWSWFQKKYELTTNDLEIEAGASESLTEGTYDHASLEVTVPKNKLFDVFVPFAVDSYYFGADAKVYNADGPAQNIKTSTDDDGNRLFKAEAADLSKEKSLYHTRYFISTPHPDNLVQGSFNYFDKTGVKVLQPGAGLAQNYPFNEDSKKVAYWYTEFKSKEIQPSEDCKTFVLDNGVFKMVNGSYTLNAAKTTFDCYDGKLPQFLDEETGEVLATSNLDFSFHKDLSGYTTFYNEDSHCLAPADCEVYVITEVEYPHFELVPVTDGIINQGQAVLIKTTDSNFQMEAFKEKLVYVTNPSSATEAYAKNLLMGVAEDTSVEDLCAETSYSHVYVLSCDSKKENTGFYKFSSGRTLPAGKAYLAPWKLSQETSSMAALLLPVFDPTAINGANADGERSPLYDISGHRVNDDRVGIIISNNRKVIKK